MLEKAVWSAQGPLSYPQLKKGLGKVTLIQIVRERKPRGKNDCCPTEACEKRVFSTASDPSLLGPKPITTGFNAAPKMHEALCDLQMELLFPNRIQISKNGLGTLLGFAHLHSHVRVTGSCLVLGLQALGTHHCNPNTQRRKFQSMLQKSMA